MGIVHAPQLRPYPADVLSMPRPMRGILAPPNNRMSHIDSEGEEGFLLHHKGPFISLEFVSIPAERHKNSTLSKEFIEKDHETDYDREYPGCGSAYR